MCLPRTFARSSTIAPILSGSCCSRWPASLASALNGIDPTHVFIASWLRQPTEAENIRVNAGMVRNLMDALRRSVEGARAPSGGTGGAKGGAERAPDKKADKAGPAKKGERTEKAAPKARATTAKTRTRKAG